MKLSQDTKIALFILAGFLFGAFIQWSPAPKTIAEQPEQIQVQCVGDYNEPEYHETVWFLEKDFPRKLPHCGLAEIGDAYCYVDANYGGYSGVSILKLTK